MEVQTINPLLTNIEKPFIVSNTLPVALSELREEHIIPVFTKDNHPLISQSQIIELTGDVLSNFPDFELSEPQIRVSHPVKGRIPEAKNKKAIDLLPNESTIYYERMMFVIQIPNVKFLIMNTKIQLVLSKRFPHFNSIISWNGFRICAVEIWKTAPFSIKHKIVYSPSCGAQNYHKTVC